MSLFLAVAVGLLGWSTVGNLLLGETLYVVRNVGLATLLLVLAHRAGVRPPTLGIARSRWRSGLRWGGGSVAVIGLVIGLGVLFEDRLGPLGLLLQDDRADLGASELAYHALLRIPLGTALFEEIAFRSVLLGLLMEQTTRLWAVLGSSVVFGLWHVPPTVVALEINGIAPYGVEGLGAIAGAVAVTTVAGVLFCALRLASGSLLAPVLAHWGTNGLGLLAAAATDGDA